MKIGPFEPHDAEAIENILDFHSIPFEIDIDEAKRDEQIQENNDRLRLGPNLFNGSLDLRYISFEIADADFQKISNELEPFGIV